MTLTIELTPEVEARLLAAAQRDGIEPAECIRRLLADSGSGGMPSPGGMSPKVDWKTICPPNSLA